MPNSSCGEKNLKLQSMEIGSFVASKNTNNIVEDLQNIDISFDSNNLNESNELLSHTKKVIGKFKTESSIFLDRWICFCAKINRFHYIVIVKIRINWKYFKITSWNYQIWRILKTADLRVIILNIVLVILFVH